VLIVVEEQVLIRRPREEVFEFFTSAEKVSSWAQNVIEFARVAGAPREPGAQMRGVAKVAGRRVTFTVELLAVERGYRTVERSLDATIPYTMEMRFSDDGEGTRVVWHQEVKKLTGLFWLLRPVVLRLYGRDVRRGLANARAILENDGRAR
jgi:uncharacterized protein YndB with AHSA1/START domain